MAQPQDLAFHPSSPRSSSAGADSFKGTPDTRLTGFSSEDVPSRLAVRKVLDVAATDSSTVQGPPSNFAEVNFTDKDPFVTPLSGNVSTLSPTASAFSPFGNAAAHIYPTRSGVMLAALSVDLGLSRYLRISSSAPVPVADVYSWLTDLELKSTTKPHGHKSVSARDGHVFLQFSDIRDACSAHAAIHLADNGWAVEYINPARFIKDSSSSLEHAAIQTGQVAVSAGPSSGNVIDTTWAIETVHTFLQRHGQLFALVKRSTFPDGSFRAIAEFCDASIVLQFLKTCATSITIEGIHLVVSAGDLEMGRPFDLGHAMHDMSISKDQVPRVCQQQTKAVAMRPVLHTDMHVRPHISMYPWVVQPPLGSSMPYAMDPFLTPTRTNPVNFLPSMTSMPPHYSFMSTLYQTPPSPPLTAANSYSPSKALTGVGRSDVRRQNAARVNRSPYHNPISHHNHVDTSRIREGTDVRTTIMLRNIPNKVDQAMLKRIVDESSWGKYDFMYLRIDFANDCNVGYAFINFVDPLDIIDFVEARGNQRWNCFKSDKVAEISYATIQGKDCLVQKFRNSSVMLEAPHYRPKLFFTSNGPMPELAGQEEPFPEPDNQSKMKRSCENAEHVGLFTPNAGQHFRDEQRRRRSQYDRGTRLAALEEYDYDTAIQHIYTGAT